MRWCGYLCYNRICMQGSCKKEAVFAGYASKNKVVRQLIDLALLQNNMLKGEALNNFVKRSIELI